MIGWAPRRYALGRMTRRIAARPLTFLFSVGAAAAALFVPMLCAAIAVQLWPLPIRLAIEPEVSVFVVPGTGGADVKSLMARLNGLPGVVDVRLVPRDEALAELTARNGLGSAAGVVAELKSNPLPDVLIARLRDGISAETVDEIAAGVRKWNRVDAVAADSGWYRKWSHWRRLLVVAATALVAITTAVLIWVVVSAVRLQAAADRDEVRTLLLVGADSGFLRRPYAYLGAATTALAMAIALALAALAIQALAPQVAALSALYGLDLKWGQPPLAYFGLSVLGAALAGGATAACGVRLRADRGQ